MTSYKIQELIDEHKEDMNENLYLQLCNKLMKLNRTFYSSFILS